MRILDDHTDDNDYHDMTISRPVFCDRCCDSARNYSFWNRTGELRIFPGFLEAGKLDCDCDCDCDLRPAMLFRSCAAVMYMLGLHDEGLSVEV